MKIDKEKWLDRLETIRDIAGLGMIAGALLGIAIVLGRTALGLL